MMLECNTKLLRRESSNNVKIRQTLKQETVYMRDSPLPICFLKYIFNRHDIWSIIYTRNSTYAWQSLADLLSWYIFNGHDIWSIIYTRNSTYFDSPLPICFLKYIFNRHDIWSIIQVQWQHRVSFYCQTTYFRNKHLSILIYWCFTARQHKI